MVMKNIYLPFPHQYSHTSNSKLVFQSYNKLLTLCYLAFSQDRAEGVKLS